MIIGIFGKLNQGINMTLVFIELSEQNSRNLLTESYKNKEKTDETINRILNKYFEEKNKI